jgi:hypothetical protein
LAETFHFLISPVDFDRSLILQTTIANAGPKVQLGEKCSADLIIPNYPWASIASWSLFSENNSVKYISLDSPLISLCFGGLWTGAEARNLVWEIGDYSFTN